MSLRASRKVPKHGLFYFKSDRMTCVLSLNNCKIAKVISGDNVSRGSQVMLKCGSLELEAEIIGVNDDPSELHRLEVEFLTDPANAHLFEEPEPELVKRKRKLRTKKKAAKKCKKEAATQPKRRKEEPEELPTVISLYYPPTPTQVLPQQPTPVQPVQPRTQVQQPPPTPVSLQPCTLIQPPVQQPPTPRMSPLIGRSPLALVLSLIRRKVTRSLERILQQQKQCLEYQELISKRLDSILAVLSYQE